LRIFFFQISTTSPPFDFLSYAQQHCKNDENEKRKQSLLQKAIRFHEDKLRTQQKYILEFKIVDNFSVKNFMN